MADSEKSAVDPAPFDTPEFQAAVQVAVTSYLDANLADLVAAAMPETPEEKAKREAQERADVARKAQEEREAENAAKKKAEEDAAKKAARARKADKTQAKRHFDGDAELAAAQVLENVDYTKLIDMDAEYVVLADDGDAYCIDFAVTIDPSRHLDVQKDRGVSLKIPVELSNLVEQFSVHRLTLRKAKGDETAILRNEIVQPFWAGNGRAASFAAGSLLFRVTGK